MLMEVYSMSMISEAQLAKIANIESIYIHYPNIQKAKNKLKEVLELNSFLAEPECVLLTGDSGSGKTSFIKQFVSHYPVIYDDEVDIRTVIYVEIPSQASIKDLCIVILKAFDDPVDNSKLTKLVLGEKVINFAKLAKTKLLILDEFQHLTEKSTLTKVDNLANWIKNFINVTRIPVLIVGMPESEYVLSENAQLSRRFYTRYKLEFFSLATSRDVGVYYKFLKNLSGQLDFDNSDIVINKFYSISLYYVANKNLALFMRIIRFACRVAILQKVNHLKFEHFLHALNELRHYQYINDFIYAFRSKNYEVIKTSLVNEKVDWSSIDEQFSHQTESIR